MCYSKCNVSANSRKKYLKQQLWLPSNCTLIAAGYKNNSINEKFLSTNGFLFLFSYFLYFFAEFGFWILLFFSLVLKHPLFQSILACSEIFLPSHFQLIVAAVVVVVVYAYVSHCGCCTNQWQLIKRCSTSLMAGRSELCCAMLCNVKKVDMSCENTTHACRFAV